MKTELSELRCVVDGLCAEILVEIGPACHSHSNSWARVIREQLESTCPNFQLVLNYIHRYCQDEECVDFQLTRQLGEALLEAAGALNDAEREALYSLQQEASLASTGPKRSLDH
jgi:hypothetical protein